MRVCVCVCMHTHTADTHSRRAQLRRAHATAQQQGEAQCLGPSHICTQAAVYHGGDHKKAHHPASAGSQAGRAYKKKKRHRHRHRHLSVSMCTFVCVKQVNWAQEVIKEPKPPVIDGACGPNILILILAPPPHHRQYVHFCTRKASKVGVVRSHRANESASVERKALRFR